MIKLLKLGLFLCVVNLFFLHDIHGQRIFKNKEVDFYTSGIQAMNTGSVFVADLNENDEFCNSVTVWNCTDGSLTIEILSALDVVGFQTVPSSHSLVMSLSSDRFDELTISSSGSGDILVNGIRDNRDVGASAGNVNTALYYSNCQEIDNQSKPVIETSVDIECNEVSGFWEYFYTETTDGVVTNETNVLSSEVCQNPKPDYEYREICNKGFIDIQTVSITDNIETIIATLATTKECLVNQPDYETKNVCIAGDLMVQTFEIKDGVETLVNSVDSGEDCYINEPFDIDSLPYIHKVSGSTADSVTHRLLEELLNKPTIETSVDIECDETTNTWTYFYTEITDGVVSDESSTDSGVACSSPKPFYQTKEICVSGNLMIQTYSIVGGVETLLSSTDTGNDCFVQPECDCSNNNQTFELSGTSTFVVESKTTCNYSVTVFAGEIVLNGVTIPVGGTNGNGTECTLLTNDVTITGLTADTYAIIEITQ